MFYKTIRATSVDELNLKVNAEFKHGFRLFGGASGSSHVTIDPTTEEDVVHECFLQTLVKDDGATPIVRNAADHVEPRR